MNELTPSFVIQVWLDGDDYPPTATDVFLNRLAAFLKEMTDDGLIHTWSLDKDDSV